MLLGGIAYQLDCTNLSSDLLGQNLVARDGLDLDFLVVRHVGDG